TRRSVIMVATARARWPNAAPRDSEGWMQSALHGMLDKARRYSQEPDRLRLEGLSARVRGDNSEHVVTLTNGRLTCDCDHYPHERLCAHVLTVERVFRPHLPANV